MKKTPKLQIIELTKEFPNATIFSNFSIELEPGVYALKGESGCGKSTLVRIVSGLDTQRTGDILLNGEKVVATTPKVHMMHQHYTCFPWKTVLENALSIHKAHKTEPTDEDIEEAKNVLTRLGLGEHMDKLPSALSGGQRQRLCFAVAYLNRYADVVCYDEPTAALDNMNDALIAEMILERQKLHNTIEIIITHESHVIEALNAVVIELTPEFRLREGKANKDIMAPEKKKFNWFFNIIKKVSVKRKDKNKKIS